MFSFSRQRSLFIAGRHRKPATKRSAKHNTHRVRAAVVASSPFLSLFSYAKLIRAEVNVRRTKAARQSNKSADSLVAVFANEVGRSTSLVLSRLNFWQLSFRVACALCVLGSLPSRPYFRVAFLCYRLPQLTATLFLQTAERYVIVADYQTCSNSLIEYAGS